MSLPVAFVLLLLDSEVPGEIVPSEIVVVAKPRRCDLSSGGRPMRDSDFKRYAAEWAAGRPVRVVVPYAVRTRCLAKIMFKLHDRGVMRAEFVDAPGPVTSRP